MKTLYKFFLVLVAILSIGHQMTGQNILQPLKDSNGSNKQYLLSGFFISGMPPWPSCETGSPYGCGPTGCLNEVDHEVLNYKGISSTYFQAGGTLHLDQTAGEHLIRRYTGSRVVWSNCQTPTIYAGFYQDSKTIELVNFSKKSGTTTFCLYSSSYDLRNFLNWYDGSVNFSGNGVSGHMFDPSAAGEGVHTISMSRSFASPGGYINLTVSLTVYDHDFTWSTVPVTCESQYSPVDLQAYTSKETTFSGPGVSGGRYLSPYGAGDGEHTITATRNVSGCTTTKTTQVTIDDQPATPNAGPDRDLCVNEAIDLFSDAGTKEGVWSGGFVSGSTFKATTQIWEDTPHVITLTVKGPEEVCTATDTRDIYARANPSPIYIDGVEECERHGLVQLPEPAYDYWSASYSASFNTNIIDDQERLDINQLAVGDYTLNIRHENDYNTRCAREKEIEVRVFERDFTFNEVPDYCASQTAIELQSYTSQVTSFTVSPNRGLTGSTFNPNAAGAGTYTFTATYNNGTCTETRQRTMEVFADVAGPDAGDNFRVCKGEVVELFSNGASSVGTWSGEGVSDNKLYSSVIDEETTVTVTLTVTNGACQRSDSRVVTVDGQPAQTTLADITACERGGAMQLENPEEDYFSGTWTGPLSGYISPGGVIDFTSIAPGSYTMGYSEVNNSNSNCSMSDSPIVFTVVERDFTFSGLPEVCASQAAIALQGYTNVETSFTVSPNRGLTGTTFNPNAAGAGNYTFTATYNNGTCTETRQGTMVVYSDVTQPNAGLDLQVCKGEVVDLNSQGASGTGTWTGAGVTGNMMDTDGLDPETDYTMTLTVTNGACQRSDSRVVTVNGQPAQTTLADITACERGGTLQLEKPEEAYFTGSWSGALSSFIDGDNIIDFTSVSPGSYTMGYSEVNNNNSNCSMSDSPIVFTVVERDFTFSGLPEVCASQTAIELQDYTSQATSFTVSPNRGLTGSTFNPNAAGAGNYTFTATYNNGTCTETRQETMVVYSDVTQPNAGLDLQACKGEVVDLNSQGASGTGTWTGAGVTGNMMDTDGLDPETGYTMTLTVTNGACQRSDSRVVTVNGQPAQTTLADITACERGGTLQLEKPEEAYFTGSWSGALSSFIDGDNIIDFTSVSPGSYTMGYSEVNNNNSNCSMSDSPIVFTVVERDFTFSGLPEVCASQTAIELQDYTSQATSFTVSPNRGLTGSTFNPNAAGAGNYTFTATYNNGTCTETRQETMVVYSDVTQPNAGLDLQACKGEVVDLNSQGASGTGTWTGAGVTGNMMDTDGLDPETGYTMTLTVTNGACQRSDSRVVTVNGQPAQTTLADITACERGGTLQLEKPEEAYLTGSWSGALSSFIDGDNIIDFTSVSPGSYTMGYSEVNNNNSNCSMSDSPIVFTVVERDFTFSGLPEVCASQTTIELQDYTSRATSFTVEDSDGNFGRGLTGSTFNPNAAGAGTYTFTASYDNGVCVETRQGTMVVYSDVIGPNAGTDIDACAGEEVALFTGGATTDGVWSGDGVSGDVMYTQGLDVETAHTATLTVSNGACVKSDDRLVMVREMPVQTALQDLTFCNNTDTIQLYYGNNALMNTSWYAFNVADGNREIADKIVYDSLLVPALHEDGEYHYLYTEENINNSSCAMADTVIATVNVPTTNWIFDVTISDCKDSPAFDLYEFSSLESGLQFDGGAVVGHEFLPSLAEIGKNPVTASFENEFGCVYQIHDTVLIVEDFVVDAGELLDTCSNAGVIELTGGSPEGGTWSGPGVVDQNHFDPSAVEPDNTYTLTYSVGRGGCAKQDTREVFVRGLPDVDAGNNFQICEKTLFYELVNTGFTPAAAVWYSNVAEIDALINNTDNTIETENLEAGEYYLFVVFEQGGCSDYDSVKMVINPQPEIPSVESSERCGQGSGTLAATGKENEVIKWYRDGEDESFHSGTSYTTASFTTTQTYYVTANSLSGCESEKTPVSLIINQLPAIDAGEDQFFCDNSTRNFDLTQGVSVPGDGELDISGDGVDGTIWNATGLSDGDHIITYKYTDEKGCEGIDTRNFTIGINPDIRVDKSEVAMRELVTFSSDQDDALSVLWDFGDGFTSTEKTAKHYYYVPGSYDVRLSVELETCTGVFTMENFVTVTGEPIDDVITEIVDEVTSDATIYPNPFYDHLRVNGVEEGSIVRLVDLSGKVIAEQAANEGTVLQGSVISNLPQGIYLIRVESKSGNVFNFKVVKK
jgi:PKD repeat protein